MGRCARSHHLSTFTTLDRAQRTCEGNGSSAGFPSEGPGVGGGLRIALTKESSALSETFPTSPVPSAALLSIETACQTSGMAMLLPSVPLPTGSAPYPPV